MSDDIDDIDEVADIDHNRIETDGDDEAELGDEPTIAEDVLAYLTRSVVEDPDSVDIDIDEQGNRLKMTVTVGDGDMGRVIGRRGRIANAIRTIVRAAGTRDDVEVEVEFED
jgi:predicted RNA-binding protein YlqC (UPF0109 family)